MCSTYLLRIKRQASQGWGTFSSTFSATEREVQWALCSPKSAYAKCYKHKDSFPSFRELCEKHYESTYKKHLWTLIRYYYLNSYFNFWVCVLFSLTVLFRFFFCSSVPLLHIYISFEGTRRIRRPFHSHLLSLWTSVLTFMSVIFLRSIFMFCNVLT